MNRYIMIIVITQLPQPVLSELFECGYEWTVDSNEPCLNKDNNNKMFPIAKVWKRIINGTEDSVKSFYDIGIAITEGRFPKL